MANELGMLTAGGEISTGKEARRALEILIGEPAIRASVDHCIALSPGHLLAEGVLRILRPWTAMAYCYEIWNGSDPIERRRQAVRVLRCAADERALKWVAGFLDDPDEHIQSWGSSLLDQLLWCGFVRSEDCEELLARLEGHPLEHIRQTGKFIRNYVADNKEWLRICAASDAARQYAERS